MDVEGQVSWDVATSGQFKNLELSCSVPYPRFSGIVTIKIHLGSSVTEAMLDHKQCLALQEPERAPVTMETL